MALLFDRSKPVERYRVSYDARKHLCSVLFDQNLPISERVRALGVRHISGTASLDALTRAMRDSSSLLAYNAAYELGRIKDVATIPALEAVLRDISFHPIVRHKAAEALGAFSSESVVPILKSCLENDPVQEVRDTCELALTQIERPTESCLETDLWPSIQKVRDACDLALIQIESLKESCLESDIYPKVQKVGDIFELASPHIESLKEFYLVQKSRDVLLNEEKCISERYTALFGLWKQASLQNDAANKAFSAITEAVTAKSTILRHGVAYVLSRLKNKDATSVLSRILKNILEHPLVRLEAAKALGSITEDNCKMLLEEFAQDLEPIVSQSCEVALKKLNLRMSGELFDMVPLREGAIVRLLFQTSAEQEEYICNVLLNKEEPMWQRFRAFSDRMLDGPAYLNALITAMWDTSSLLAYTAVSEMIGMHDVHTIPALKKALADHTLHSIVRHKAAEALGAFGLESNVPALKASLNSDPALEVRETCELALSRIEELKKASPLHSHRYAISILPVFPGFCYSFPKLRDVLFSEESTMYDRVSAIFEIVKLYGYKKNEEVISAIFESRGAKSTLLRYWVVNFLSRIEQERAVDALSESLQDRSEHPLIRQEAAKGLGHLAACGVSADSCISLLKKFSADPELIVAQRCQVADKLCEFEKLGQSFKIVGTLEDRAGKKPRLMLKTTKQTVCL